MWFYVLIKKCGQTCEAREREREGKGSTYVDDYIDDIHISTQSIIHSIKRNNLSIKTILDKCCTRFTPDCCSAIECGVYIIVIDNNAI